MNKFGLAGAVFSFLNLSPYLMELQLKFFPGGELNQSLLKLGIAILSFPTKRVWFFAYLFLGDVKWIILNVVILIISVIVIVNID